jgi:hypothetical protein
MASPVTMPSPLGDRLMGQNERNSRRHRQGITLGHRQARAVLTCCHYRCLDTGKSSPSKGECSVLEEHICQPAPSGSLKRRNPSGQPQSCLRAGATHGSDNRGYGLTITFMLMSNPVWIAREGVKTRQLRRLCRGGGRRELSASLLTRSSVPSEVYPWTGLVTCSETEC